MPARHDTVRRLVALGTCPTEEHVFTQSTLNAQRLVAIATEPSAGLCYGRALDALLGVGGSKRPLSGSEGISDKGAW